MNVCNAFPILTKLSCVAGCWVCPLLLCLLRGLAPKSNRLSTFPCVVGDCSWSTICLSMSGQYTLENAIGQMASDLFITGLSMAFPVGGALAGMLAGFIVDKLFPAKKQPDPYKKLADSILQQAADMIDASVMREAIGDHKLELLAIQEQLAWVPSMLMQEGENGGPTDHEKTAMLSFNLMLQHDLGKISVKIRERQFKASSCSNKKWAFAIMPIAHMVMLEQVSLLAEIST